MLLLFASVEHGNKENKTFLRKYDKKYKTFISG